MTTYNGWTNYATWRVQLELFSELDLRECRLKTMDAIDLADWLKEFAQEVINSTSSAGLARDYALAFLADVNWVELAFNARDEYADAYGDESADDDESEDA